MIDKKNSISNRGARRICRGKELERERDRLAKKKEGRSTSPLVFLKENLKFKERRFLSVFESKIIFAYSCGRPKVFGKAKAAASYPFNFLSHTNLYAHTHVQFICNARTPFISRYFFMVFFYFLLFSAKISMHIQALPMPASSSCLFLWPLPQSLHLSLSQDLRSAPLRVNV